MSDQVIDKILDKVLAAWALTKGLQVAWPNVAFTPSAERYLKVARLRVPTDYSSIGTNGILVVTGIYQVSVVSPMNPSINPGTGPITTLTDEMSSDVFVVGAVHSSSGDGVDVRITNVSLGSMIGDDQGHVVHPLSVAYRTTINQ